MVRLRFGSAVAALLTAALAVGPVHAGGITVTNNTDVTQLVNTLLGGGAGGITVTNATLDFRDNGNGAQSSGIYTTSGPNNYNLTGSGIVISSGNAAAYGSGPNNSPSTSTSYGVGETAAQKALLDPLTGGFGPHFDVTELTVTFDAAATTSSLFFDVVFGSEEFPEFVGKRFVDAFGLYLNGANIAFVGGLPVNINDPAFADVPETELDGVLAPGGNPLLTFSGAVTPGSKGNTLTFIIADTSDSIYDSTAYIAGLGDASPGGRPRAGFDCHNDYRSLWFRPGAFPPRAEGIIYKTCGLQPNLKRPRKDLLSLHGRFRF